MSKGFPIGTIDLFVSDLITQERRYKDRHLNLLPAPAQEHSPTSKTAASYCNRKGNRAAILLALDKAGPLGMTDLELQQATGLSGDSERPARVALCQAGLVHPAPFARMTQSKRNAVVWLSA